RRHFRLLVQLGVVALWVPVALTIYLQLSGGPQLHPVLYAVTLLIQYFASLLLTAGAVRVISDSYLGHPPRLHDALSLGFSKIWPLFVVGIGYAVVVFVCMLVPGVIAAVLIPILAKGGAAIPALIVGLALFAGAVWFLVFVASSSGSAKCSDRASRRTRSGQRCGTCLRVPSTAGASARIRGAGSSASGTGCSIGSTRCSGGIPRGSRCCSPCWRWCSSACSPTWATSSGGSPGPRRGRRPGGRRESAGASWRMRAPTARGRRSWRVPGGMRKRWPTGLSPSCSSSSAAAPWRSTRPRRRPSTWVRP